MLYSNALPSAKHGRAADEIFALRSGRVMHRLFATAAGRRQAVAPAARTCRAFCEPLCDADLVEVVVTGQLNCVRVNLKQLEADGAAAIRVVGSSVDEHVAAILARARKQLLQLHPGSCCDHHGGYLDVQIARRISHREGPHITSLRNDDAHRGRALAADDLGGEGDTTAPHKPDLARELLGVLQVCALDRRCLGEQGSETVRQEAEGRAERAVCRIEHQLRLRLLAEYARDCRRGFDRLA
mmetsp:Transcript_29401/g.73850  ORF Transcript_29401/g.73850 Transcript_29401/m.73850 type:complete len:241 (-) Transcript_29401:78-800(-)